MVNHHAKQEREPGEMRRDGYKTILNTFISVQQA